MTPEQEKQFYAYLARDLVRTSNLQFRTEKDITMAIEDVKKIIELDKKGVKISDICRKIGRYKPHAISKMIKTMNDILISAQ